MARRIGVLEADERIGAQPQRYVSKSAARYLLRKSLADKRGPRIIQMRSLKVATAEVVAELKRGFFDGPLGTGNVLPFSPPTDATKKHHYEMPMAGDRGVYARHHLKAIRVSHRNLFAQQAIPPRAVVAAY